MIGDEEDGNGPEDAPVGKRKNTKKHRSERNHRTATANKTATLEQNPMAGTGRPRWVTTRMAMALKMLQTANKTSDQTGIFE